MFFMQPFAFVVYPKVLCLGSTGIYFAGSRELELLSGGNKVMEHHTVRAVFSLHPFFLHRPFHNKISADL